MTSHEIHNTFCHSETDNLKHLHRCCADIPASWSKLASISCDACLRAKATRQHSSAVHVVTEPGEIVSMDLWSTRTPCIIGGETTMFGGIDNFSSCADLVKIKSKTDVPAAVRALVAWFASHGVKARRFHTDNENIFHSDEAREATVEEFRPQGILITTGCEYESNQNGVMERYWCTCRGDAQAQMDE